MSALTAHRKTLESGARVPNILRDKIVKTKGTLYLGAIGAIDASNLAVPASDTASIVVLGAVVDLYEDNSGNEHAVMKSGLFAYDAGSSGEALDAGDIGSLVYALDDHTFGAVGGTNKIKGGVLRDLDADGKYWFEIGNIRLT